MIEVHLGSLEENTFVSYRLERLGADWVLFITGGGNPISALLNVLERAGRLRNYGRYHLGRTRKRGS